MSSLDLRRLRQNEHVRALTREVHVQLEQLIQPLFVAEGLAQREPVPGLTGVHQESVDSLLRQVEHDLQAGVHKFLLFGVPRARSERDIDWSFTAGQVRALKQRFGHDIWLATDVCLCSSTPHGHCGVLNAEGDHLDNHASVLEIEQAALSYAQAGADCVAPSDMMDGRIGAIRSAFETAGLVHTRILAYAAKYASSFYGPFRDAVGSAKQLGGAGKHTYQMDPANSDEALREVALDIAEGADMVMIKPGLPYLDIVRRVKDRFGMPTFVYQVSGEYAMIMAAAGNGWLDERAVALEALTAMKRAGADAILTYFAKRAAGWLRP
jgi:porphobilinogen synthase